MTNQNLDKNLGYITDGGGATYPTVGLTPHTRLRPPSLSPLGWVSVRSRLPDKSGIYPACAATPDRSPPEDWADALCYYNAEAKEGHSKWQHSSGFFDNGITHWLPLPSAP